MIRYRLTCANSHDFEAWFKTGSAFDTQAARGAVTCPVCGISQVTKAMMAPNLGKSPRIAAPEPPFPATPNSVRPSDARQETAAALRRLRQEVAEKVEYVGPRFAEEARRIEAGEAVHRGIYGEATLSEARALIEDGIAVLPLPRALEDLN